MVNLYYHYQVLLLLGSLLVAPLHAANYNDQDDEKYPEKHKYASNKSFYEHGDLTFFDYEKDNINQKELKQGLIDLSYRIKAKDSRKVYFVIGGTRAGKSMSILALQGNKIKRNATEDSDPDESDEDLFDNVNDQKNAPSQTQFEIAYVLPKKEVPVVGHSATGQTASTLIYYPSPNPQKPAYKSIAFADTEGFFGKRKATSAGKCLSAISLSYALRANKVGGLVFVISTSELDANQGEGLRDIAHVLQQYFAKAVHNGTIKKSLLVMITKARSKHERFEAFKKLRQHIQFFYQEYYADFTYKKIFKKGVNEVKKLVFTSKDVEQERKKEEGDHQLKLFFELLLEKDVPKDKINDISNFKLDSKRFCCIFPWNENNVRKILDKKLLALQPIDSDNLCTFDNPVSQYIEASIRDYSLQLNKVIQFLIQLKRKIDSTEKQLEVMIDMKTTNETIEVLEKSKIAWLGSQSKMENDSTLEVVFEQLCDQSIPDQCLHSDKISTTLLPYTGREPIYKIVATYGKGAGLSENSVYWAAVGSPLDQFNFIAKHFNITEKKDSDGIVTWKAVAKHGKGVVKKDKWLLYYGTTGPHKAQCEIKFYARRNEGIATLQGVAKIKKHVKQLTQEINFYHAMRDDYNALMQKHKELIKKLKEAHSVEKIKTWAKTVQMLQLFADEILAAQTDKALIKMHLKNFNKARQLFPPLSVNKGDNPKKQQSAHSKSFYKHGDLTFLDEEKDKVDLMELKQGLIDLSYQIKAKEGRKVYFFIGATGAGKSASILALQGNKIKKVEEEASDLDDLEEDISLIAKNPFEIASYVLPKKEVPVVGDAATGQTAGTLIYYPDPKKLKYSGIAFADTEGFFGKRKATSAEKCLAAVSFPYALKLNKIGGFVLVISRQELEETRGRGLNRIANILQQYFAKAVRNQTIKRSILVMITKVSNKSDSVRALKQLKQCIQLCYEEYHTGLDKKNEASKEEKKQEDNRRLKHFFAVLLKQDVPKDQIHDIDNFKLDMERFCSLFPWSEKSVQKILDKKLTCLQSIAASDLCSFDKPVAKFIAKKIGEFSSEFNSAIQPLLGVAQKKAMIAKQHTRLLVECKKKLAAQVKKSKGAAHMLELFANEILQESDKKAHIKAHLENFEKATQLSRPFSENKENNQKDKPYLEDEKANFSGQPSVDGHQGVDREIFDID